MPMKPISASTIRNEFQRFRQKLPPIRKNEEGPCHDISRERRLHGDNVFINAMQYTSIIYPGDLSDESGKILPKTERKILHAGLLINDQGHGRALKVPGAPVPGERWVNVNYEQDGKSLTRSVSVSSNLGVAEEIATVHPGKTMAHVERSDSYAKGWHTVADLLTPDEKDILREWNLTSLA